MPWALTLMYGSEVPPMSRAGSSEHWMVVTFRVWVLKSYSSCAEREKGGWRGKVLLRIAG